MLTCLIATGQETVHLTIIDQSDDTPLEFVNIINLNSKQLYYSDSNGQTDKAQDLFKQAITSSADQDAVLNINTQAAAARFYNSTQNYTEEIALRKQNIEQINALKKTARSSPAKADSRSNTENRSARCFAYVGLFLPCNFGCCCKNGLQQLEY